MQAEIYEVHAGHAPRPRYGWVLGELMLLRVATFIGTDACVFACWILLLKKCTACKQKYWGCTVDMKRDPLVSSAFALQSTTGQKG